MKLSTLIDGIELAAVAGVDALDLENIRICDITEDSRTALPGSLFIARNGTKEQGGKYIDEAIRLGAVAVITDDPTVHAVRGSSAALLYSANASKVGAEIAERFYGSPSEQLQIVGVTGTNGKTTIAHLTQQLIKHAKIKCGLIGTVEIDDGRQRGHAMMTTPPAIELSRTLSTMVEHGCKACSMEVSSHALDQGRTSAVRFAAAGFTNLTGDHLDYHKTLESYGAAKQSFFTSLQSGSVAVINIDDPASKQMIEGCAAGVEVQTVSMSDPKADWFAEILDRSLDGILLRVHSTDWSFESRVPFFGAYNASNVLISLGLASTALKQLGLELHQIETAFASALPTLALPQGRLERAEGSGDDIRVFVDFAHSDDSLRSCLQAVNEVLPAGSTLWCVFGCGGDRDRTKRPRMGQAACEGAGRVVLTSDNPRSEPPSQIVDDVLAGLDGSQRERVDVHVDRAEAIKFAIGNAKLGDVVVIAGKGHEREQIITDRWGRTIAHDFDDAAHARAALAYRNDTIGSHT